MIQEHYRVKQLPAERAPNGEILHAAYVEELPTCIGQGSTPGDAERMARAMLGKCLERLRVAGQPIPAPLGRGINLNPIPGPLSKTAATAAFVSLTVAASLVTGSTRLGTWDEIGKPHQMA